MIDELKQKKLLFYSTAYFTNINYLIVLILISIYADTNQTPYYGILIWAIPAAISVLFSIFIIRNNIDNDESREKGLMKIAMAHVPSIIGLMAAMIYLFI